MGATAPPLMVKVGFAPPIWCEVHPSSSPYDSFPNYFDQNEGKAYKSRSSLVEKPTNFLNQESQNFHVPAAHLLSIML